MTAGDPGYWASTARLGPTLPDGRLLPCQGKRHSRDLTGHTVGNTTFLRRVRGMVWEVRCTKCHQTREVHCSSAYASQGDNRVRSCRSCMHDTRRVGQDGVCRWCGRESLKANRIKRGLPYCGKSTRCAACDRRAVRNGRCPGCGFPLYRIGRDTGERECRDCGWKGIAEKKRGGIDG